MQKVLANLALAHAPLAALVGNRIQWDTMPQGSTGAGIVMFVVSGVTDYHMQGPTGWVETRVQFDCRANAAAAARDVAEVLEQRLSGYAGTFQGYRFDGIFKESHRTRFDKDGALSWFTASMDFTIWWSVA